MRTFLLISLFFNSLFINAQTNKSIGVVGNKQIDLTFLQNLQTVNPHFSFTEDTTYLKPFITKYYSRQMAMADSVKKLPVYDSLKTIIEDIRKMTEAKLLADYYMNTIVKNATQPTDKEITDYYQANKNNYLTTPVYSYFQAYAAGDDKNLGKVIKSNMEALYKQSPGTYQNSKKVDANYTLNFENNVSVLPGNTLYSILKNCKVGEVSGPFTMPGRTEKLYLLVTFNIPETVKPLADVKADIKNTLSNNKRIMLEKAVTDKANREYPIKFY